MFDSRMTRRSFLTALGATLASTQSIFSYGATPARQENNNEGSDIAQQGEQKTFTPWKPGTLDIHHIATGSGCAALFIFPDGTSMMVDAGAIYDHDQFSIAPIPNGSRRPGEWIGRYARRHLQAAHREEIDYFVLTHFHRDHMGQFAAETPKSKRGDYALTGVTDVAEIIPIKRYIDRGYPTYDYPLPLTDPSQKNYRAFIQAQEQAGAKIQQFQPGSNQQIHLLRKPSDFPTFSVQNIFANGEIWTGQGNSTRNLFAEVGSNLQRRVPTENECSLALRLNYGNFKYYTGGDLSNNTNYGEDPWRDVETPVAEVTGHVDVAVANHHAYVDGVGPGFVRALRPRSFILMTWDSAHPSITSLACMLSKRLYPNEREIYATAIKPENLIVNRQLSKLTSQSGHIVVRVSPDGKEYRIVILDSSDESDRVVAEHGPFTCA